jgi:demethylmenaquinone methyltransferase / 2-methoxy-6-polyprenyl-1,4-benzoquinol methylase
MNKGVQKIFGEVPQTYELVNHVLTFGMDVICRRRAARIAAEGGGIRWLDVCSGTGEMAANLVRLSRNGTSVFAADFSLPMLSKATEKKESDRITFVIADVKTLPFPDNSFDLITISFATRNINIDRDILIEHLKEFHRVLRPGGRFVNLETSQPRFSWMRRLMHLYVKLAVKPIGSGISGSKAGYAYLSHTIPRFYQPEEFAEIIQQAGFGKVTYKKMFGGVIAVHKGIK